MAVIRHPFIKGFHFKLSQQQKIREWLALMPWQRNQTPAQLATYNPPAKDTPGEHPATPSWINSDGQPNWNLSEKDSAKLRATMLEQNKRDFASKWGTRPITDAERKLAKIGLQRIEAEPDTLVEIPIVRKQTVTETLLSIKNTVLPRSKPTHPLPYDDEPYRYYLDTIGAAYQDIPIPFIRMAVDHYFREYQQFPKVIYVSQRVKRNLGYYTDYSIDNGPRPIHVPIVPDIYLGRPLNQNVALCVGRK